MLQESSVIEQDQIRLPHNNETSSTHNDEFLSTANENNCELKESVVKDQLLPSCKSKHNCLLKINEDRRSSIHDQYWKLPYNYRTWIHNHVKVPPTKRPRKETKESSERSCTRLYILEGKNNSEVVVCKIFFLHILSYSCDKVTTVTLNSCPQGSLTPPADIKGKHPSAQKLQELSFDTIQSHIKSNTHVSHYRQEHAPQ